MVLRVSMYPLLGVLLGVDDLRCWGSQRPVEVYYYECVGSLG
jgi:hypothetical protein